MKTKTTIMTLISFAMLSFSLFAISTEEIVPEENENKKEDMSFSYHERLLEIDKEMQELKSWQSKYAKTKRSMDSKANRLQYRSSREATKFRAKAGDAQDHITSLQDRIDALATESQLLKKKCDLLR